MFEFTFEKQLHQVWLEVNSAMANSHQRRQLNACDTPNAIFPPASIPD